MYDSRNRNDNGLPAIIMVAEQAGASYLYKVLSTSIQFWGEYLQFEWEFRIFQIHLLTTCVF